MFAKPPKAGQGTLYNASNNSSYKTKNRSMERLVVDVPMRLHGSPHKAGSKQHKTAQNRQKTGSVNEHVQSKQPLPSAGMTQIRFKGTKNDFSFLSQPFGAPSGFAIFDFTNKIPLTPSIVNAEIVNHIFHQAERRGLGP
jgi:hypothetical protein